MTVTGTMDADRLVDYVYRRTKKQAKVVPQPEPEPEKPAEEGPKPEEKKEEKHADAEEAKAAEEEKKDPPAEEEKKEGGDAAEEEEEEVMRSVEEQGMYKMMYHYQPIYMVERIPPAPQLFSDENPNACTVM